MSNILITGANGQLGNCLRDLTREDTARKYYYTDVAELDITDEAQIEQFVTDCEISVIINAAGYTAVDRAENDVEKCYLINRDATRNLAQVAAKHHCFLVHISTDYVFDGKEDVPHKVTDRVNPQSVYGKSKWEGEVAMAQSKCDGVIIRTSWLYSEYGGNFVKTMLKLGKEKEEIRVVNDQFGGPTYARDLAEAILKIVTKCNDHQGLKIYHFANRGVISWNDFARQIMANAGLSCRVLPVSTLEYNAIAPRPAHSAFDLTDIERDLDIRIPQWDDSLLVCMQNIENQCIDKM